MRITHCVPTPTPPNRLSELYFAAGLSRADVASSMGVDSTTVWRWETGRLAITDKRKEALAALLDVSIPVLMGWDNEPPRVAGAAA